jgi:hypothetical protein
MTETPLKNTHGNRKKSAAQAQLTAFLKTLKVKGVFGRHHEALTGWLIGAAQVAPRASRH